MSNYTKNTNFSAKDSLPTGDPNKIILGSLFDAEFDEIAVAIASKEDAANKNQNNGYAGLDSSGKLPTSLFGNTTVPDAALSSNVPLKNAASNSFTGDITVGGSITGSGTGLTNIPDGALSSNVALKNAVNTFSADQVLATNTTTRLYLSTTGAAADQGRTYLSTAGTTGQFAITSTNDAGNTFRTLLQATKSGAGWATITFGNTTDNPTYTFAGTGAITGNGSGLTSLNASNLASGTVADARLSSNVPLKNAGNVFSAAQTIASTAGGEQLRLAHDSALLSFFDGANSARTGYLWMRAANAAQLWVEANQALQIGTNNTARMTIGAAGNVTINEATNSTTAPALRVGGTGTTAGGYQVSVLGSGTNNAFGLRDTLNSQEFRIGAVSAGGGYTVGTYTNHSLNFLTNNTTRMTIGTAGGVQIGSPTGGDKGAGTVNAAGTIYQNNVPVASLPARTSSSTTLAAGQAHYITGNATLPALAAGEWVSIINNSGSPITISESLGYTTYWTTSGASVSTVTLAARGRLFAEGVGSSVAYVSGDITGFT